MNLIFSDFNGIGIGDLNYHVREELIKEFTELSEQENLEKTYIVL